MAAGVQAVATGPRGAYAKAHGIGRGRRTRIWAPIAAVARPSATIRCADQPLTALTPAHAESWR